MQLFAPRKTSGFADLETLGGVQVGWVRHRRTDARLEDAKLMHIGGAALAVSLRKPLEKAGLGGGIGRSFLHPLKLAIMGEIEIRERCQD